MAKRKAEEPVKAGKAAKKQPEPEPEEDDEDEVSTFLNFVSLLFLIKHIH